MKFNKDLDVCIIFLGPIDADQQERTGFPKLRLVESTLAEKVVCYSHVPFFQIGEGVVNRQSDYQVQSNMTVIGGFSGSGVSNGIGLIGIITHEEYLDADGGETLANISYEDMRDRLE